mgnify:CR=1 FL=1
MDRGRRVVTWRWLAFILVLFAVVFTVALHGVMSSRRALEEQYAQQEQRLASMENYVAQLKTELVRVGTDDYVENAARESGFYRRGEMRFEFSDPQKLQNYTAEEWQVIIKKKLY